MPADRRPGAAEITGAAKNAASSNVKMLPAARPPAFCDVKMAATLVQGAVSKESRPRGAALTGRLSMPWARAERPVVGALARGSEARALELEWDRRPTILLVRRHVAERLARRRRPPMRGAGADEYD